MNKVDRLKRSTLSWERLLDRFSILLQFNLVFDFWLTNCSSVIECSRDHFHELQNHQEISVSIVAQYQCIASGIWFQCIIFFRNQSTAHIFLATTKSIPILKNVRLQSRRWLHEIYYNMPDWQSSRLQYFYKTPSVAIFAIWIVWKRFASIKELEYRQCCRRPSDFFLNAFWLKNFRFFHFRIIWFYAFSSKFCRNVAIGRLLKQKFHEMHSHFSYRKCKWVGSAN